VLDFLRNPVVQAIGTFLGAVLAVVSILLAIFLYFRSRQKKSLSYEVISQYPLISVDDEIKGRLKILLDGMSVQDVHLLIIKLINNGNVAVTASDYERPLNLNFSGETEVISANIAESSPKNLIPTITKSNKSVTFNPILINPNEFFTLKILVTRYNNLFNVDDRIAGVHVRPIRQLSIVSMAPRVNVIGAVIALSIAIVTLYLTITTYQFSRQSAEQLIVSDIHAAKVTLQPGERTTLTIDVEHSGTLKFDWRATRGVISPSDAPGVIYTAPTTSGQDEVELVIINGNNMVRRTIAIDVVSSSTPARGTQLPKSTVFPRSTITPSR
jgi:hypothetical protein